MERMERMEKVKIGFLGCGHMGQLGHLQNYAMLDGCELVALADCQFKRAQMVAQAYSIARVYASMEELLDDREVEAVVAVQQPEHNVDVVCEVLNSGRHLLTEKPLCIYPENGRRLVDCAAANNKVHMVANHKRSDPATEYGLKVIKKWKASNEMGRMNYIRIAAPPGDWMNGAVGRGKPINSDEAPYKYIPEPVPAYMDKKAHDDYFGFVNYWIHQVNLMRFLLGEDFKLTFGDRSGLLLAVESDSGITGTIEMAIYNTTDSWHESAFVCFEKGYVDIRLPAPLASQRAGEVTVFTDNGGGGVYSSPALPNVGAMRNQAMNFIKAAKGEAPPPCPSSEALKDLEFSLDYINYMRKYRQ